MPSAVATAATWTGGLLVATLLAMVGPVAPTQAAEADACLEETASETLPTTPLPPVPPLALPLLPGVDFGCDDITPPDTRVTVTSLPDPSDGAIRSATDEVTFDFEQVVLDGDTNGGQPWAFKCRLAGPGRNAGYEDCGTPQSPTTQSYTGLQDTTTAPYVFSVYAVDVHDSAIHYTGNPLIDTDDEDPALPDDDSRSPATVTWHQDTVAPNTFVFGGPRDDEGTGWPISRRKSGTVLTLDASESDVTYQCRLNGVALACPSRKVRLRDLPGGDWVFRAQAIDSAGNLDETAATRRFLVPFNLATARGWKLTKQRGAFERDVLTTRKKGATIRFRADRVREVRVLAPSGRGLGKFRVRMGRSGWKTFNPAAVKASRSHDFVVRGRSARRFTGRVLIQALGTKPARVDALVFPPR